MNIPEHIFLELADSFHHKLTVIDEIEHKVIKAKAVYDKVNKELCYEVDRITSIAKYLDLDEEEIDEPFLDRLSRVFRDRPLCKAIMENSLENGDE